LLEVMADGEKPTGLVVGLGPDGRFRVDVDSEGE
jgi:hypothetical protein